MRYYYVQKSLQLLGGIFVLFSLLNVQELCHDDTRAGSFLVYINEQTYHWIGNKEIKVTAFQAINTNMKGAEEEKNNNREDTIVEKTAAANEGWTEAKELHSEETLANDNKTSTSDSDQSTATMEIDESSKTSEKQPQSSDDGLEEPTSTAAAVQANEVKLEKEAEMTTAAKREDSTISTEEFAYFLDADQNVRKRKDATNEAEEKVGEADEAAKTTTKTSEEEQKKREIYNVEKGQRVFIKEQLCVEVGFFEVLGIGQSSLVSLVLGEYLGIAALCIVLSLLGLIINVIQVRSSVFDPKQGTVLIYNAVHVVLWIASTVLQYLHMRNNEWLANSGMFTPVFYSSWILCFVLSVVFILIFILETLHYHLLHYNIYLERSAGVYKIVEPHYGNIYKKTTVEPEDI